MRPSSDHTNTMLSMATMLLGFQRPSPKPNGVGVATPATVIFRSLRGVDLEDAVLEVALAVERFQNLLVVAGHLLCEGCCSEEQQTSEQQRLRVLLHS